MIAINKLWVSVKVLATLDWRLHVVLFFFFLAASQAAAQARSQSPQQSAAASSITGMSLQEAQQILNISTLSPEEIQKVHKHNVSFLGPHGIFATDDLSSTFSALIFISVTVGENALLEAECRVLKTDLRVFVSFRTSITFSKSMTKQWAVHFTFSQKWVISTWWMWDISVCCCVSGVCVIHIMT